MLSGQRSGEHASFVSRYMRAVIIYHGAVVEWLGRFDVGISPIQWQRLAERMERAERICRSLRAELERRDSERYASASGSYSRVQDV
jgi:hypothetical protein